MADRTTPHADNPAGRTARKTSDGRAFSKDEITDELGDSPPGESEPELRMGVDTGFDRIVGPEEAGLGGGLDQAEEAQLGVTDEELAEMARRRGKPNQ